MELENWTNHHIAARRGPLTFFMTSSCAENWWPGLHRLMAQLDTNVGNKKDADLLRGNDFKAMKISVTKYPLYVNNFSMKRVNKFMTTVVKEALGI